MKKWFLLLLALAVVGLLMTASAEDTLATNEDGAQNLEIAPVVGETVEAQDELKEEGLIVEDIDLDALEEPEEIVEYVDLDEEEPEEELLWPGEEDGDYIEAQEDGDYIEAEEIDVFEYVDLDAEHLVFPELYCEILEDTFELAEPAEGAQIIGGHYQGELLWAVDIVGDYWLMPDGGYISADDIAIYNEDEIPGASEVKTIVNPRIPRDMKVVLCPIASDVDYIAETFHSCVIYDTIEKKLYCFKLGVETLEVSLEPLSELSQLYSYWTIDEDFLQEDAYAIGWEGIMEKVYQYTLPGSYFVIFQ